MSQRWVRKDRRIYPDSHCLCCASNYGILEGELRLCRAGTCLACGTRQCWCGLNDRCAVCYFGILTSASSGPAPVCGYKGCKSGLRAVARVPRVKYACTEHLWRSDTDTGIRLALALREKSFVLFDDESVKERL